MSLGTLSHYDLLERIGVGAESNIYCARDRRDGRVVAIKDVTVSEPENYKYLGHVRNEYHVLRTLHAAFGRDNDHCQIVHVYDLLKWGFLRQAKRHGMVMEYVGGKDLRRERRYPLAQLVDIFSQVAGSLAAIHQLGYLHADLKPENIIVGARGKAVLVDFGFSCRAGTRATSVRGTRDYMAPEQVNCGVLNERTDIYNFGATMYYLLTERHVPRLIAPANGDVHFISGESMPLTPVRELNAKVPPLVARLVEDCCIKEADERPASMARLHEALKESSRAMMAPEPSLTQD